MYRIHMVRKHLNDAIDKARDSQAYVCQHPQCKKTYDIMDFGSLEMRSDGMLVCGQCRMSVLERQDNSKEMLAARDMLNLLDFQLRDVLDILDKGDQLCVIRNSPTVDSSLYIMAKQQCEAERATSSIAASSVPTTTPMEQLDIRIEMEDDTDTKRKREVLQSEEGERRYKEKAPPWLRFTSACWGPATCSTPSSSPSKITTRLTSATSQGVKTATRLAERAVKRHKSKRKRHLSSAISDNTDIMSSSPPCYLKEEPYLYYIDLLGLRNHLREEQNKADEAEFVSVEDYIANQAATTTTTISRSSPSLFCCEIVNNNNNSTLDYGKTDTTVSSAINVYYPILSSSSSSTITTNTGPNRNITSATSIDRIMVTKLC
jgi:hypothetical protein